MDDEEAVRLALDGDPRGPEALLSRYGMTVYNVGLRMLGNPADAEDVAQDVFLRAFTRLHQYRRGEPFGAWLHGIARHRCLDVLRSRPAALTHEVRATADVEAEAIAGLESARVRRALTQLPDRDRALLILRYWEDQPVADVGRMLGMSEGATKVALLRARRSLGQILSSQLKETGNAV